MGKKKSKKDGVQKKQKQGGLVDTKRIGTAVAGVLVGELVNAAVQKLSQKALNANGSDADKETGKDNPNLLQNVASEVGDRVGKIERSAGNTAEAVRLSASNLTVNLSDVIEVLQDTGEQLKEQSADVISTSSEAILGNVSQGAVALLARVIPDTQKKSKKDHKGKKSKKKKS